MLLVAAVVALARGAEVFETDLAPTVQGAGDDAGAPPPSPNDNARRYRRNMRLGVAYAVVLPALSAGLIAVATANDDTQGVMAGVGAIGVAFAAPLVVGGHAIGATNALRRSGVPISDAPAITAIVLDGTSVVLLGVEVSAGATAPVLSASTWAGAYLLSVTQLVVAGASSHRADRGDQVS